MGREEANGVILAESTCLMNADEMVKIKEVNVFGSDLMRVTPNSELSMELELESLFPLSLQVNSISVSLT